MNRRNPVAIAVLFAACTLMFSLKAKADPLSLSIKNQVQNEQLISLITQNKSLRVQYVEKILEDIRYLLGEGQKHQVTFTNFPQFEMNEEFQKLQEDYQKRPWMSYYTRAVSIFWKKALNKLSADEKEDYFFKTTNWDKESRTLANVVLPNVFNQAWLIEENLSELMDSFPARPEGVKWDAEKEQFAYDNPEVRALAIKIAAHFVTKTEIARAMVRNVSDETLSKFQFNTQLDTPESKTEPFDLIQGELTRFNYLGQLRTKATDGLNRIMITKLNHRFLHKVLKLRAEADGWGAGLDDFIYFPLEGGTGLTFYCAGTSGTTTFTEEGEVNGRWAWGLPSTVSLNALEDTAFLNDKNDLVYDCDNTLYKITITKQESEALPKAEIKPLVPETGEDNEVISTLISFAMHSEANPKFLGFVRAYMQMLGYKIKSETSAVNTLEYFKEELPNSNFFIPVAHSLSYDHFHIGNEVALLIQFEKSIETLSGKKRTLVLNALFPEGAASYQTISAEEISDALYQRLIQEKEALFVLNASCGSERTVFPWTLGYRKAANRFTAEQGNASLQDLKSTPHVFGSKRNFPTSSFSGLIGNFSHPLHSVETLAIGETVEQVYENLQNPAPEKFIEAAKQLLESEEADVEIENKAYEPVYNMKVEDFLKIGSLDFNILNLDL